MSKRPGGRRAGRKVSRARTQRRRREREPDLVDWVAMALEEHPLSLLELVSGVLEVLEPPRHPLEPAPPEGLPDLGDLVESCLGARLRETSALLGVLAAFTTDEVFRRRAHREIADRADALPAWLAG